MALLYRELGIDLGTVNTLIAEGGEIVLSEPTMAAIDVDEQKIVALGQEAKDMYGRVPEGIQVMYPLRDGVIADYEVTERILAYFIQKVCGPVRLFKPRAMVTVPYGVTSVEGRAAHEATFRAGSREVILVQRALAAAVGAGLPIGTPSGNMVVYLGGGASESAVISVNGIVVANTVRVGGQRLDEAIATYVRHKHGLVIGETTAEELKLKVGSAVPLDTELSLEVQGRDQVSGLPRKVRVTTADIEEALADPLAQIVSGVRATLERTPPELTSDIIDRGMMLCGGGSLLRGVDRYFTQVTGVPAYLAEEPVACLALGAERVLKQVELFRRFLPPS
ncbi:MAG: rod shape-determining protein [Chloroflexi bacterium RBG_16_64_43]|nr:MAG: rod shape-determining protein [Chloroflexi bacterium RBG_16_64_43]